MRVQSDKPAKSGGWMHRIGEPARRYLRPPPKWQPPTINATKLMRDGLAATTAAALAEFAASLGVSTPSLVAVGAAWAPPHAAWAFPMCDGYGNVVGIRLRNERGKFAVRGSRQGIFLAGRARAEDAVRLRRARRTPPPPSSWACSPWAGRTAVAAGAEIRSYARRHECAACVIISDNDKPGLDGARKVGGELKLPFAIYVPPAKDLREFVRLGGTRGMIENTLKRNCLERMKKPSAYLPFYGNDFFEAIAGYSDAVGMGYLRALWHYWNHTGCDGLPDDDEYLRRVCGCERSRVGAHQGDHLRQPVSFPAGGRCLASAALPEGVAQVQGDVRPAIDGRQRRGDETVGEGVTMRATLYPELVEKIEGLGRRGQVLAGIWAGKGTKEIAADLGISPKTVEYHRARLYRVFGVNDLVSLCRRAIAVGIDKSEGRNGCLRHASRMPFRIRIRIRIRVSP